MTDDIQNLDQKIKKEQDKHAEKSEVNKALNAGLEFTAPILGGIFIGYWLDQWLDTKPIFIISLLLLGVASGIMNIYKASQNIGGTVGYSDLHAREKNAKTSPSNDSENKES